MVTMYSLSRIDQMLKSGREPQVEAGAHQMTYHKYGWGIVDRHGKPWWEESCVCQDRTPMLETVDALNDPIEITDSETEKRRPFRVVRLIWQGQN